MSSSNKIMKKRIDNFIYNDESVLGKGQFGYVYKGYDVRTNEVVAIKVIPVSILENKFFEHLLINEIGALKTLSTPYVVRFIDLKLTLHNIYLITEFCDGGDLSGLLQERGKLPEEEVIDILWQIAEAFKAMKQFNMLHRDLKPPNILLNQGLIKVADLGFSKTVDNFQASINNSTVGSPIYMSPQVLFKQVYTSKCDIWSLGIVVYQLFQGKVPWHALDIVELANKIRNEPILFPKSNPISTELKDFIIQCLKYEEAERISWDDIFDHPALKKSKFAQKEHKTSVEACDIDSYPKETTTTKKEKPAEVKVAPAPAPAPKLGETTRHRVQNAPAKLVKKQTALYDDSKVKPSSGHKTPPTETNSQGDNESVYSRNAAQPSYVTKADIIPLPGSAGQQPEQQPLSQPQQPQQPAQVRSPYGYQNQMPYGGAPQHGGGYYPGMQGMNMPGMNGYPQNTGYGPQQHQMPAQGRGNSNGYMPPQQQQQSGQSYRGQQQAMQPHQTMGYGPYGGQNQYGGPNPYYGGMGVQTAWGSY